jgi:DNA-binding NtrC family response regulator
MKQAKLIAIDDNKGVLRALEILFKPICQKITCISSPDQIECHLLKENYDVVLLDMNFKAGVNSGNEGLYWMRRILKQYPAMKVILITAYGEVDLAVQSIKEGAFDFILKPWKNDDLLTKVKAAYNYRLKSKQPISKASEKKKSIKNNAIIGKSGILVDLISLVKKVAVTDVSVLITGENGTGKELVARELHRLSSRADKPFITVDMGAITETLFESEMFGHKKGAFTDAHEDRIGKFEAAQGGTLFLDEIGNLPLVSQAKLLTALQNKTITRVGDHSPIQLDIRLICATNANLSSLVKSGGFREDLLYRINTISVEAPPLRKRGDDIIELAKHFILHYGNRYGKDAFKLTSKAQSKMMNYAWPGNIRELRHVIEKAVILSETKCIGEEDVHILQNDNLALNDESMTIEEMERRMIINAIKRLDGNLSLVSEELGISRPTLYNKLKKYDLSKTC